jgi:hypothetical protein
MDDKKEQTISNIYSTYIHKLVKVVYIDDGRTMVCRGEVLSVNDTHIQMTEMGRELPSLIRIADISTIREDLEAKHQKRLGSDGQY